MAGCNCTGACRRPPYTCAGAIPFGFVVGLPTCQICHERPGRVRQILPHYFEAVCEECWGARQRAIAEETEDHRVNDLAAELADREAMMDALCMEPV